MAKAMFHKVQDSSLDVMDELYDRMVYDVGYKKFALAAAAGVAIYVVAKKMQSQCKQKAMKKKGEERQKAMIKQRDALAAKISVNGVLMTPERVEIVGMPTETLITKMRSGAVSCVKVLRAFQAKAIEVTRKNNSVCDFIEEAEEWARAMETNPNQDFPLRGLPVSIKEDIAVANYDCTLGYVKYIGRTETADAVSVAAIKRLGAIPFCKTNVPQTIISFCCTNPVYGTTTHWTHPDRSPGGSTGGELALIAGGGSVLGIGSDILGSLRAPAQFSGYPSFKPTKDRISGKGQRPSVPGSQGVHNSVGLNGRDVDSILLGAKALLSNPGIMHDLDPQCVPIPWREDMYKGKSRLRIGYYDSSNFFPSTPGVKRAVAVAVRALKAAGHDLVPFDCPDSFEDVERIMKLFLADNGKLMMSYWADEPVEDALYALYLNLSLSPCLKSLLHPFLRLVSKRGSYIFGASRSGELWQCMRERQEFINKTVKKWKEAKLDLLLVPGFACPAVPTKLCSYIFPAMMCTGIYNHLDFPTGSVPVSKETAADQAALETWDTHGDYVLKLTKKAVRGGEGLPLNCILVGLPWDEELVLRGMKELQESLRAGK